LAFALAIGIIFWPFLAGGAVGDSGLSFQPFSVTSGSVLPGLAHLVGFVVLILMCFAIGLNLLLHGVYPEEKPKQETE
jgi:hypothetical protein